MTARPIAAAKLFLNRMTAAEGQRLLAAATHSPAVSRERFYFVCARVRQISIAFSILTALWIVVDAMTFPWPLWGQLALGRAAASLAFLGTAVHRAKEWPTGTVFGELISLFLIPLVFFLFSNFLLKGIDAPTSLAAGTAYHYLPFIIAAGLGLFPLTILESAVLAAAIVATMVVAIVLWPSVVDGQSQVMTIWRLIVIAGIGALASLSQLHFLIRLTDQSTRDGLTGLLVRRVGEELLESQFAYAQRHKLPLCLLFIDLDNFKSVNDVFGHPAGDAVLREVAASLKRAFRGQESVIRWGGEEFVIALPATDMSSALASVQRLAQLGIGQRPDGTPMTASIGIAESNLDRVARLQDLSDLADKRMYMAKQAGRNRYQASGQAGLWLSPTKAV